MYVCMYECIYLHMYILDNLRDIRRRNVNNDWSRSPICLFHLHFFLRGGGQGHWFEGQLRMRFSQMEGQVWE
jgi:hypothetical protein